MASPRWITAAEVTQDEAGDVQGPTSSTDGNLAVFDGTTGKLLKDGGAVPGGGGGAYRLGPFKIGAFDAQSFFVAGPTSISGGTFTITVGANTTAALAWNISNANLKTALEALQSVGAGNVISITGTDINDFSKFIFAGAVVTEIISANGASLTGPDAPYDLAAEGADDWSTELFTPAVGDSILDFQHAVITEFDPNSTRMCYSDDPVAPFSAGSSKWTTTGPDNFQLDDDDGMTNFYGSYNSSLGFQRTVKGLMIARGDDDGSIPSMQIPIVCKNAVPIYAALQNVTSSPVAGEVWIWVDIVPATAP